VKKDQREGERENFYGGADREEKRDGPPIVLKPESFVEKALFLIAKTLPGHRVKGHDAGQRGEKKRIQQSLKKGIQELHSRTHNLSHKRRSVIGACSMLRGPKMTAEQGTVT